MVINNIKKDVELVGFIKESCEENEVGIKICEDINKNDYVIIKVDEFYNSLNLGKNTPPSIDCLIFQICKDYTYSVTLLELKSTHSARTLTIENLIAKFTTCLNDFMTIRFKDYFNRDYKKIKLYFISNIIQRNNRDLGLKLELLLNTRFIWKDKKMLVDLRMPTPMIRNC